jgi:hypothetical protein
MSDLGDFPEEIPTPVGSVCEFCEKVIEEDHRGRVIQWEGPELRRVVYHRDCFDEAASMGIGG